MSWRWSLHRAHAKCRRRRTLACVRACVQCGGIGDDDVVRAVVTRCQSTTAQRTTSDNVEAQSPVVAGSDTVALLRFSFCRSAQYAQGKANDFNDSFKTLLTMTGRVQHCRLSTAQHNAVHVHIIPVAHLATVQACHQLA